MEWDLCFFSFLFSWCSSDKVRWCRLGRRGWEEKEKEKEKQIGVGGKQMNKSAAETTERIISWRRAKCNEIKNEHKKKCSSAEKRKEERNKNNADEEKVQKTTVFIHLFFFLHNQEIHV